MGLVRVQLPARGAGSARPAEEDLHQEDRRTAGRLLIDLFHPRTQDVAAAPRDRIQRLVRPRVLFDCPHLRAAVESTGAEGFGAFAGLHPLGDGRFLAASTDGVGTKLILARQRGRLRDCGADLAAHCINDVATCGAEPLMLLDYIAANEIRLEDVAELVEGAAAVCREVGMALVGGETAELPGIYAEEELDFAGTCVGVVHRD